MRVRYLDWIGVAMLVGCSIVGCDGQGDIARVTAPELLVTPERLTFSTVNLGTQSTEVLTIQNTGEIDVSFTLRLVEDNSPMDSTPELTWAKAPGGMTDLAPGDILTVAVHYNPVDTYEDTGRIVIAPLGSKALEVPITTAPFLPYLDASPSRVVFERVAPGETAVKLVTLQNVGNAPLRISELLLEDDSPEFAFCLPDLYDKDACAENIDATVELAPLETLPINVIYTPFDDGEDLSALLTASNATNALDVRHRIEIVANSQEPCILVTDENGIDFMAAFIGNVSSRTVTISNCSQTQALEIDSIAMLPGSDDLFFVDSLPEMPLQLESDQSTSFVLNYAPIDETIGTGQLEILSNDPAKTPLLIPVQGRGTERICPTAIAQARSAEDGQLWGTEFEAAPLATILFDGTMSSAAEGTIATYEWSIIESPVDSTSRLSSNQSPSPTLFLDLAGRYVVELRAYDAQNTPSCDVSTITIIAIPREDIHVQLVWDTPADSDQTDIRGTDLDLHVLNPRGDWNSAWDCYWDNKTPSWGPGGTDDDPSLDIDDTDGSGPENMNLTNPENVTYRIGVHYFDDFGFGSSYATLRIYVRQRLVFEYRDKRLEFGGRFDGKFWDAATIEWPSGRINQVDQVYNGFP